MVTKKSHVLEEVTIVIPSHYRHNFLYRNLDYHQNVRVSILVADSTNTPFVGQKQYPNVKYFHYPNSPFHLKMADVFQHVETPYVAMCADDDFMIPSSIKCCIEFLENHSDYASVQGHYVSFRNGENLEMGPLYTTTIGYHIDANTVEERIKQVMNHGFHQHYSIHHTEILKNFFQENHSHYSNRNLGEIALPLIAAINGKHKVIPVFHMAREAHLSNEKCYSSNLKESEICLELVADYFCQKTGSSLNEGLRSIEQAVAPYFKEARFIKKKQASHSYLRYGQNVKNKIYKSIKPFVPEFILFLRKTIQIGVIKGYPYFDTEAKKEWETIKSYILKHNIKSEDAFKAMEQLEVW